jgi:hypothetical protein
MSTVISPNVINTSSFVSDLNELAHQLTKTKNIASVSSATINNDSARSNHVVLEPPKFNFNYLKILQQLLIENDTKNLENGKNQINVHSDTVKMQREEENKALEASRAAYKRAQSSGAISKIFGWIAAAFTAVIAVALVATGVGAIAGAIMMTLALDQLVGMATGTSLMGEATKGIAMGLEELGMDPATANIIASVIILVVVVVATVGASATSSTAKVADSAASLTKGATTAAGSTSGATAAAGSATNSATAAFSAVRTAVGSAVGNYDKLRNSAQIITASTQLAGAATSIDSAVHKNEADLADVDRVRIEKIILQQQDAIENLIEKIKEGIANREATFMNMTRIIDEHHTSINKITSRISA